MKDYPERSEHTQILHYTKNRGLAAARNTALDHCQTEWLIHLDSDDSMALDIVEKMVKHQQETDADIVITDFIERYADKDMHITAFNGKNKRDYVLDIVRFNESHYIWGKLLRTSLYNENGIRVVEGVNVGEDWQQIVKLYYYANRIDTLHEQSVYYTKTRTHALTYYTDTDEQSYRKYFCQILLLLDIIKDFLSDKDVEFQEEINKTIFNRVTNYMAYCASRGFKQLYKEMEANANKLVRVYPYLQESIAERIKYKVKKNFFLYRQLLMLNNIARS